MPRALDDVRRDLRQQQRLALLLGTLLWVVLATSWQWRTGRRLAVVPWLALAPLTASLGLAWLTTGIVAVAAVLAVLLLSADLPQDATSSQGLIRIAGSASLAAFAVVAAEVRVRREERVRRLAEVAAVAQATILHPVPAAVGGVRLASRYVSASRDALVGGDLYDVVATADGVPLLLGDARGKGLPAVQTAAAVLSTFRGTAPRDVPLDELARRIDLALRERGGDEDFVTVVLCDLTADGSLAVVNCGHPSPLRLSPGRSPEPLGSHRSPPLGLGLADPVVERTFLEPGDRVLLYTDGLIEARDHAGQFYDLPRAATLVAPRSADEPPEAGERGLDRLMATLLAHVGGVLRDDVAVLLAELPAAPVVAARRSASQPSPPSHTP